MFLKYVSSLSMCPKSGWKMGEMLLLLRDREFALVCSWEDEMEMLLLFSLWVMSNCVSCSVQSDSLWPHGLEPTRLLCPWNSPGKHTGVGCHFLFQGVFPTQESNLSLLHWQVDALPLSHQGSLGCLPSARCTAIAIETKSTNLFLAFMERIL